MVNLAPISGYKMLELKKDIASLRQKMKKTKDSAVRKKLKIKLREKEMYYNILAERIRTKS